VKRFFPIIFFTLCISPSSLNAFPGGVIRGLPAPGNNCTGLAFDGKNIWVADHALDELLAVDPRTGKVQKRFKSPGYRPAGLAFDGEQLWNVDVKEKKIYRIGLKDGLVTRTIPAPIDRPRALAFDGRALWVSDDKTRTIHRVDPRDGTTIREVPFPSKSVDGLAFDGRYLWVTDRLADRLFAVHLPTGEVLVTLKSPGPHPTGLGWNGKELISVDYQSDRISIIRRDDKKFLIEEDPRDAWVVFTHQVRNFGPDPLPELDVYLAVPRDLQTQRLLSPPEFEPKPAELLADQWGQKVARFTFKNVAATGVATVRMKVHLVSKTVHWVIYPERVKSLWKIPADVRRRYLVDTLKYDVKNPVIQKAVKEAVGAERNPYWIARKIYRYIHKKMHYEMVGGWDVAPKLLQRGSGSCSEYSYVFISMCRAAGLPARYVGSLVVRKDDASYDDVYHRWVEVYLPPYGWVPVDPSRGDKSTEAERADSFGHLYRDFLITTHGGGGSTLLDWNYNYNQRFTCKGRCKVDVESIAEWSREDPDTRHHKSAAK
jgi:transglutaminase-like putative cysteine protease